MKKLKDIDGKKIEKFLSRFPDETSNWSEATDEIRDIARCIRLSHNELDLNLQEDEDGAFIPMDFSNIKDPSTWNKAAKLQIRTIWPLMGAWAREQVIDEYGHLFGINK